MVIVILDDGAGAKENRLQARNADTLAAPEQPEGVCAEDNEPLKNLDEARQEPGETQEKTVAQEENCLGAGSIALSEVRGASGVVEGAEQRDAKDATPVQEKEEMKHTDEGEVKEVTVEATATVESEAVKSEAGMVAAASVMVLDDTKAGEEVQVMEPQVVEIIDDVEQPDEDVAESDPKLTDTESSAHGATSDVTIAAQSSLPFEIRSEERGLQSESAEELSQLSDDQNSRIDAAVIDNTTQKKYASEKESHASVTMGSTTDQPEQDHQAAAEVEVVLIEQVDTTPTEIDAPADSAADNQISSEPETTPVILITEGLLQSSAVVAEVAISNKTQVPDAVSNQEDTTQFKIFDNVSLDNREFPILRGSYVIKSNHRAVFSGNWGFCDADFTAGGDRLSKFEYTSIYLHGRHDSDRRPFSGKYGGYFNFRQFSGKIIKIKEEQVELNFVKLPGDNKSENSGGGDDDSDDEEAFAKCCYEVYGSGKNRFGRFLIRGFLSPATSKLLK
uniref:Uncharacterized protein n=1 Tax=Globisporangium ultimum (strain ATCC 200006 / CBS 805.95 / DAOM BR144) TaxID=431595 RepID=K3XB60_GLOUD